MSHYGEAALASECQLLRTAANGSRNSQLNKAAYAMARLVASGEINASQAKRALHEAAKETGLDEKEIHATIASGWKAGCGKPRYIYRDANGTPLYAKKRVGNSRQKYIVEHQNGGVWSCGRGGADPVPYRLPELLASDGPVYMTEGEKHADRLAEWGLVATSLKDWKPEFARYIQGRPVIILPDNDEEGQNQAAKARDLALAAGCTVRVVKLPGLPHKGDIMDWDGTAEELAALVDKTAPIIRPPMVVEQSVGAGPTKMLRPLDLARLANIDPTPKQFAIEGLAPLGEVTLFTGPGSAGKSLFGQQMATAAAAGLGSCLGLGVANAPAVFLTCEDDSEELHWRQKHICKTLGTTYPTLYG
ncbi:MAG: AAA family ATPase, partial [Sphingobium sp.]